ncbi:UNVERIFIED_CONTAM: hypothetical protein FKN15_058358, partial [Acipenser sinensis]
QFATLWQGCMNKTRQLEVNEPQLPRQRRLPRKRDSSSDTAYSFSTPEDYYRQTHFQILDVLINQIKDRFDQDSYKICVQIESLLLSATLPNNMSFIAFEEVTSHFGSDVDSDRLKNQLAVLPELMCGKGANSVRDIAKEINELGLAVHLYSEVAKLLGFFLVIPASSASAERSFSCLRRLKTYLRATTTAQRLNSVAVLHTHKDRCTNLDLRETGNVFASKNEKRRDLFGKFQW